MKFLFALVLISSSAWSVTTCELFDDEESITNITGSMAPNCISEDNLYSEIESRASSSTDGGVICSTCKDNLTARIEVNAEDKKRLRKQAYIETMLREYKKTMSVLIADLVSVRKLYSTGANYQSAQKKCSARSFEKKIENCGPFAKNFLAGSNLAKEMANEVASLMSAQNISPALLARTDNQCSITDQTIISLKPLLLERMITPQIAQTIASWNVATTDELIQKLISLPKPFDDLIPQHPILKTISANPSDFLTLFRSLASSRSSQPFEAVFRDSIYTAANGSKLDNSIGSKCEQAVNNFTAKVCSSDFEQGNISLGPIDGFDRYNNDTALPDETHINNEALLARNYTLLEFCNNSPAKLSLGRDTTSLNDWMLSSERASTFNSFAANKHRELFGTPKEKLCADLKSKRCDPNPQAGDINCQLLGIFNESMTEGTIPYRLANNPDPQLNNVFRSLVGTPQGLAPKTREVLVAEGILPQANGQFVERPQIPERQPEYLAGVANGTITPNNGPSPVQAQATANRNQRQQQPQPQQATFQPQQGGTAIPEQVAAQTSEDDTEGLERFQEGLEERRRRAENQQTPAQARRDGQTNRRIASRPEKSDRTSERILDSEFVPQAPIPSGGQVFNGALPAAVPGQASLGKDTSRRGLAERQRNAALADMSGARSNPSARPDAGRNPASTDGQASAESTVALTISGDIRANLERVLSGRETDEAGLRALIEGRRTFRFELNNSIFDVQFNNGAYTVIPATNSVGRTLQDVFNDSLRTIPERSPAAQRTATLPNLNRNLQNTNSN